MEKIIYYKKQIIVIAVIVVLIAVMLIVLTDEDSGGTKHAALTSESAEQKKDSCECNERALIISVKQSGELHIYNIDMEMNSVVKYSVLTDIRDKYNNILVGENLEAGDIVNIGYNSDDDILSYIHEADDVWECENVTEHKITNSGQAFEFDSRKYKLDKSYIIVNNGNLINFGELDDTDEITVRGIGKSIWSIIVTNGHGYISLANADKFEGGTMVVDYDSSTQITLDLKYAVSEGEHYVELNNGDISTGANIEVKRDTTSYIDINECEISEKKYGDVTFDINPDTARLYINGKSVSYEGCLKMAYGTYAINVELSDYESYSGKLVVDTPSKKATISLAKAKPTATPSASKEPVATSQSGQSGLMSLAPQATALYQTKKPEATVSSQTLAEQLIKALMPSASPLY